MCAGQLAAEAFAHGRGEAVPVGVEPVPAGGSPAQRVDRADRLRGRVDRSHEGEGEDLVRDREVEPAEFPPVQEHERRGQLRGRHVEAMVTPVRICAVALRQRRERGVVHERTQRVPDRMSQHAKRRAGHGGISEPGEGEGFRGGHAFPYGRDSRAWVDSNSSTKLAKSLARAGSPTVP